MTHLQEVFSQTGRDGSAQGGGCLSLPEGGHSSYVGEILCAMGEGTLTGGWPGEERVGVTG